MSVLNDVLKEEVARQERYLELCKTKLSELPRGTIFKRRTNSGVYVYRKYRAGDRVVTIYIGKEGSQEALLAEANRVEYLRVLQNYRLGKAELRKIKKAVSAYD